MAAMNIFDVVGSAMSAQSQRMNVTASNLANVDSAVSPNGQPYRAKQVVFGLAPTPGQSEIGGVQVQGVVEDPSPAKMVFNPTHPLANAEGYVTMPNVNPVEEMVNMISASRSYQANVEVLNSAKNMMLKTLTLGQ
ncbi:flagellar basal body rod protein FlgC [Cupriavidus sp. USMAA2-4]|uniref:Flagellar basal-body rod protein FlgC n=1 Tax=Cupriavidus malaysiensis TaxID=367825 RepID=A0ABN4TNN1_9BURK|nr:MULTISPECIES: flagellar basal body rod protein FlgC [Cupriavidus]AOY95735.1 flagellar basal body rod protein FlgC [Cupriavidus sp. USMAA2-4]AOZ03749.1 flagellar basal body rod protein FlgC [Cupriavidus sp. USMAHM13]AOZ08882.1 flagellar basal body rod protein FlgC [Cupriavidus malaysiensis]